VFTGGGRILDAHPTQGTLDGIDPLVDVKPDVSAPVLRCAVVVLLHHLNVILTHSPNHSNVPRSRDTAPAKYDEIPWLWFDRSRP
jgi:hypothetical protein